MLKKKKEGGGGGGGGKEDTNGLKFPEFVTLSRTQECLHWHSNSSLLVHSCDSGRDFVQPQSGHVMEIAVHARLATQTLLSRVQEVAQDHWQSHGTVWDPGEEKKEEEKK